MTSFRGIGSETGGVALMVFGVAGFFLGNWEVARLLTFLVIYFGVRDLVVPYDGRRPSILVLAIGIWLAISAYEIFGFDSLNSWPLLVVLIGLSLIFDGIVDANGVGSPQAEGK